MLPMPRSRSFRRARTPVRPLSLALILAGGVLTALALGCGTTLPTAGDTTAAPEPVRPRPAGDAGGAADDAEMLDAGGFDEAALDTVDDSEAAREISTAEELNARGILRPIYFGFDSSVLSETALRTLEENARWLRQHPQFGVVVEGHCDERGSLEYNLELGAARARAVRDHLARLGIAPERIETISYGEERPVDPGHDEAAWAKNRRAEFRLVER